MEFFWAEASRRSLVSRLSGPLFMQAFTPKGRMQALLESIPVKVIVYDKIALFGAALYAMSKSPAERTV